MYEEDGGGWRVGGAGGRVVAGTKLDGSYSSSSSSSPSSRVVVGGAGVGGGGCCPEVNDARVRRTEARSGAMVVDMLAGAQGLMVLEGFLQRHDVHHRCSRGDIKGRWWRAVVAEKDCSWRTSRYGHWALLNIIIGFDHQKSIVEVSTLDFMLHQSSRRFPFFKSLNQHLYLRPHKPS